MARVDGENYLGGAVEVDETYVGGKVKNGKRGRGATNKTIVFGMIKNANGGMGCATRRGTSGLYQPLIVVMPTHSVYLETHLGGGAIMQRKLSTLRNIGIDRNAKALQAFRCNYLVIQGTQTFG